jgi:N-acetyltransferase
MAIDTNQSQILYDEFDLTSNSIFSSHDLDLLRGNHVYLEPAREHHRETLRALAKDERIWEFTKTLIINENYDKQFDIYYNDALSIVSAGGQPFIIRAVADDTILGMTRLHAVDRKERILHIGHTWYISAVWGKVHNKECKLLLLQYVFEKLQFNRAEFRVDTRNIRSQKAVRKIGGIQEGVLRKVGYRADGETRSMVVFSILDDEWPEKKEKLQTLIANCAL